MRRAAEVCCSVMRGVFFVGFTVQGILGLLWMAGNFTKRQYFAADSGLLYPLILKAAEGMGKFFHIPYFSIIYVLQTAVMAWAVWTFLKVLGIFEEKKLFRIWAVIAVMTNFITAQCLYSLLPNAFLAACLLFFSAYAIDMAVKKDSSKGKLLLLVFLWLVMAGFAGEYLMFAAVMLPAAFLLIYGKKMLWTAAAALVVLAAGLTRMSGEIWEAAFSRFAWNTIFYDGNEIPDLIWSVLSYQEIEYAMWYADVIPSEMIPLFKESLGEEGTGDFLKETVKIAWTEHKNTILHDAAWDILGYTVSPLIVGKQLKGEGFRSLSTRNYEIMGRETPILTRYYVNYEIGWARALLIAGILRVLTGLAAGKMKNKRWKFYIFCALSGGVEAIWYTMQGAGIMDYKKTMVIMLYWGILFCIFMNQNEKRQGAC